MTRRRRILYHLAHYSTNLTSQITGRFGRSMTLNVVKAAIHFD